MVVPNGRPRPQMLALLVGAALLLSVDAGEARITIRPRSPLDSFFFHASYSRVPFDPSQSFRLEIWNCASGAMPTFITNAMPLILCDEGTDSGPTAAALAYAVELPAGSCEDDGTSCYYRGEDVNGRVPGVQYVRIQYARRRHLNRVWLLSYDDLSAADQANMLLLIKVDGVARALLQDAFTSLGQGGWFSHF
jgi:hypothetical protein